MCAQDSSVAESGLNVNIAGTLHPQSQRPFRTGVVLRLHRTEPAHHIFRPGKTAGRQALVSQTCVCDVQRHGRTPDSSCRLLSDTSHTA
jgi:hypothetical protein